MMETANMTWEDALMLTNGDYDITGSLPCLCEYDNFSSEETAFVEGVQATQKYFNDIILRLKNTYTKEITE